ncbi:unnamed protein product [Brassica rapa subsp. narinosa]
MDGGCTNHVTLKMVAHYSQWTDELLIADDTSCTILSLLGKMNGCCTDYVPQNGRRRVVAKCYVQVSVPILCFAMLKPVFKTTQTLDSVKVEIMQSIRTIGWILHGGTIVKMECSVCVVAMCSFFFLATVAVCS